MGTDNSCDVLIIGGGPAGIFAALELAGTGLRIMILEKGKDIEARRCPSREQIIQQCGQCSTCATISGWGGAGAFSDGKLTLSAEVGGILDQYVPKERLGKLIRYIDDIYLRFGAPPEVYGTNEEAIAEISRKAVMADLRLIPSQIRHLGTGRSQAVLHAMKQFLIEKGVRIELNVRVDRVLTEDGRVTGVATSTGEEYRARYVIAAPGREGSKWLTAEAERLGLSLVINPVDIGIRVEVPAEVMAHLTEVIYESKLVFYSRSFEDRVRTFCMCPYGEVVTENNDGLVTVNGHSYGERVSNNTNFALLVSKTFTVPFKDPIQYGRYVAGLANLLSGGVIVQRLGDLQAGRRSTPERLKKGLVVPTLAEATPGDLSLVFPYRHLTALLEMLRALDVIAPGVNSRNTLLYGVEVKFYSSRLELSSRLEARLGNLFAVGDGAGVTRGLMQASASGVIVAEEIKRREGIANHGIVEH